MLPPSVIVRDILRELRLFANTGSQLWILHMMTLFILRRIPAIDTLCKIPVVNVLISITVCPLSAMVFYGLVVVMLALMIYKLLVILLLRLYYRENYGGLLESADAMWIAEDETAYNIINMVFLIKFDRTKGNLLNYVKEICETRFFKAKKLTSIRKSLMGYGYFLSNQLTVGEVVSSAKSTTSKTCNQKDLQKFIQRYCNNPLPRSNTAACELIVGEEPVDFDHKMDGEQYPVLFRVHHCVCDGITLLSMIIQNISDEGITIVEKPNASNQKKKESLTDKFKRNIKRIIYSHLYLLTLISKRDKNILKVPELSGEKRLAFSIESEVNLMKKVKDIKNSVQGGTFTDVILTAISASLIDFFRKKTKQIPEALTLTFMAIADRSDVHFHHTKLRNIFSMGSVRLPICIDGDSQDMDLLKRFHKTKEEYAKFNDSCDIWVYYWQLKTFCNFFPGPLLKFLIGLNDVSSVSFSNLPGFNKIHIGGQELNHIAFWVPNFVTVGIGFSLITYDDRFQMGLLVDKNLIPHEEQVQEVLDNVLKHIDLLHKEIFKNN